MQYGHMTGQVVFVHVADRTANTMSKPVASISNGPMKSVVDSSGDWCQLGDWFYQARSVNEPGTGQTTVQILSKDAEADAKIKGLRPNGFGGSGLPIPFAHRNDAEFVRVTKGRIGIREGTADLDGRTQTGPFPGRIGVDGCHDPAWWAVVFSR